MANAGEPPRNRMRSGITRFCAEVWALIKVGVRTWKVARFETLNAAGPIFELREKAFRSEFDALAELVRLQTLENQCETKVVHDLMIGESIYPGTEEDGEIGQIEKLDHI